MSRQPSIRARILDVLTEEPMTTLQLAERAGITARRRGEVVRLACDVLEDEGLIERVSGRTRPKWRRPIRVTFDMGADTTHPPSSAQAGAGVSERLARELVQGLVQSAQAKGVDPAARLHEFRTLQEAVMVMSRDPAVVQAAEQLVRAVDLTMLELAPLRS